MFCNCKERLKLLENTVKTLENSLYMQPENTQYSIKTVLYYLLDRLNLEIKEKPATYSEMLLQKKRKKNG